MGEDALQLTAALVEEGELLGREVVEAVAVGAHEMAEHGARDDGVLMLQTVDELKDIIHGVEAQTMHTRVELDMYGPTRDTLLTGSLDQRIHQTEGIHLRLQVVVEHRLEGRHLRVHDHDIGGDASLTERDTLVGHSHGEIIDTLILQGLGDLHSTSTIAVGLDHAHHLRIGLQERTEIVQVLHHGIEVHLEDGLVDLLLQLLRDLVETKRTGAFQQDQFVAQSREGLTGEEMGHTDEERLIGDLDTVCLCGEFRADANELFNTTLHGEFAHLGIEGLGRGSRLEDIAENERLLQTSPPYLTTVHEVEGDIEGVDIRVIRVVDEHTTALAFLHLKAHGHRFKFWHTVSQLSRCQSQMQGDGRTGDGILDGRLIDEGDRETVLFLLPDIGDARLRRLDGDLLHEEGCLLVAL